MRHVAAFDHTHSHTSSNLFHGRLVAACSLRHGIITQPYNDDNSEKEIALNSTKVHPVYCHVLQAKVVKTAVVYYAFCLQLFLSGSNITSLYLSLPHQSAKRFFDKEFSKDGKVDYSPRSSL